MTTPPNLERPPAVGIMRNLGLEPDPWQVEVLEAGHPRLLLNCCRQAGKSTVVAMLGLVEALFVPGTKVLLVSRSLRQSAELFRIVTDFHRRLGSPLRERQNAEELCLGNVSRIVCLPCKEETIRGYSRVSLLVIDEAARVPDDLYRAVRPMLAVCNGRLICLSTPYGKRGFFHDAWANGGDDWARIEVLCRAHQPHHAGVPGRASGGPWASRGFARNTAARSRRWRDWSIPTSPAASCDWRAGDPGRSCRPARGRHRLRFPQPVRRRLGHCWTATACSG